VVATGATAEVTVTRVVGVLAGLVVLVLVAAGVVELLLLLPPPLALPPHVNRAGPGMVYLLEVVIE
jgi:hypothetical protein